MLFSVDQFLIDLLIFWTAVNTGLTIRIAWSQYKAFNTLNKTKISEGRIRHLEYLVSLLSASTERKAGPLTMRTLSLTPALSKELLQNGRLSHDEIKSAAYVLGVSNAVEGKAYVDATISLIDALEKSRRLPDFYVYLKDVRQDVYTDLLRANESQP